LQFAKKIGGLTGIGAPAFLEFHLPLFLMNFLCSNPKNEVPQNMVSTILANILHVVNEVLARENHPGLRISLQNVCLDCGTDIAKTLYCTERTIWEAPV
jgi:hypothetical protein